MTSKIIVSLDKKKIKKECYLCRETSKHWEIFKSKNCLRQRQTEITCSTLRVLNMKHYKDFWTVKSESDDSED